MGIERTALTDKEPATQARLWLEEVAQIKDVNNDPQIAMGAAWMLDVPQFGFIQQHIRMKEDPDIPGLSASWNRELDDEAISILTEAFESLCRDECLNLIETAILLDSDDVELWRARALLLFQTTFTSRDLEPRRDDWLSVLDECARQDSDNALYDCLAALQLWTSSADYGWEDDGYILKIEDEKTFNQGDARLLAELAKPHLKFGTKGYAATMAFLEDSSVTRSDHPTAAASRQIDGRATRLMHEIMRWQHVRLDIEKRQDNFETAIAAARKVLRISEQVTTFGNYPSPGSKLILRQ